MVYIHKRSLLLFFEVKSKLMSPTTDNHKQTDLIKRTLVFPFSFFFSIALWAVIGAESLPLSLSLTLPRKNWPRFRDQTIQHLISLLRYGLFRMVVQGLVVLWEPSKKHGGNMFFLSISPRLFFLFLCRPLSWRSSHAFYCQAAISHLVEALRLWFKSITPFKKKKHTMCFPPVFCFLRVRGGVCCCLRARQGIWRLDSLCLYKWFSKEKAAFGWKEQSFQAIKSGGGQQRSTW